MLKGLRNLLVDRVPVVSGYIWAIPFSKIFQRHCDDKFLVNEVNDFVVSGNIWFKNIRC